MQICGRRVEKECGIMKKGRRGNKGKR